MGLSVGAIVGIISAAVSVASTTYSIVANSDSSSGEWGSLTVPDPPEVTVSAPPATPAGVVTDTSTLSAPAAPKSPVTPYQQQAGSKPSATMLVDNQEVAVAKPLTREQSIQEEDPRVQQVRLQQKARELLAKGRSSTVLTGSQGLLTSASTSKKTLLGE